MNTHQNCLDYCSVILTLLIILNQRIPHLCFGLNLGPPPPQTFLDIAPEPKPGHQSVPSRRAEERQSLHLCFHYTLFVGQGAAVSLALLTGSSPVPQMFLARSTLCPPPPPPEFLSSPESLKKCTLLWVLSFLVPQEHIYSKALVIACLVCSPLSLSVLCIACCLLLK